MYIRKATTWHILYRFFPSSSPPTRPHYKYVNCVNRKRKKRRVHKGDQGQLYVTRPSLLTTCIGYCIYKNIMFMESIYLAFWEDNLKLLNVNFYFMSTGERANKFTTKHCFTASFFLGSLGSYRLVLQMSPAISVPVSSATSRAIFRAIRFIFSKSPSRLMSFIFSRWL